MRKMLIIFLVLVSVLGICACDICCSIKRDKGRRSSITRINDEISAGREAQKQQWQEGLEVQIRGLRVRARKLTNEGKSVEARKVTSEIIRLNNILEASRE